MPRTLPPVLLPLGAAAPLVLLVACGPVVWHRISERRRRRRSTSAS
jgi:hypothetical protein